MRETVAEMRGTAVRVACRAQMRHIQKPPRRESWPRGLLHPISSERLPGAAGEVQGVVGPDHPPARGPPLQVPSLSPGCLITGTHSTERVAGLRRGGGAQRLVLRVAPVPPVGRAGAVAAGVDTKCLPPSRARAARRPRPRSRWGRSSTRSATMSARWCRRRAAAPPSRRVPSGAAAAVDVHGGRGVQARPCRRPQAELRRAAGRGSPPPWWRPAPGPPSARPPRMPPRRRRIRR